MACQDITKNIDLIITQYEYSPNLIGVIDCFNYLIQLKQLNILCDFEKGTSINNAFGWLLDRIGWNHGYPRPALPNGDFDYFGFDLNGTNFDQAPFYYGKDQPLIPAGDSLYKQLLKAWIDGLFFDGSVYQTNKILTEAFGKGYLVDHENLKVTVIIYDTPSYTISDIIRTGILPKVAGVQYNGYQYPQSSRKYFGFAGQTNATNFYKASFVPTLYEEDIS